MTQNSATEFVQTHLIRRQPFVMDMDGTLLDLGFDNYLWNEALPRVYAHKLGMTQSEANQAVKARLDAARGTLSWYCFDHWTREFGIDIAALEHTHRARIRFLPGARYFLAYANRLGSRLVLATNAHPKSLALKAGQTGLAEYFSDLCSSHRYGAPKESPRFWAAFLAEHRLEPSEVLFIDDNPNVLAAADEAGVGRVIAIQRPILGGEVREHPKHLTLQNLGELCGAGCPFRAQR